MQNSSFRIPAQKGAANTLLYVALTALVAVGVAITLYFLTQNKEEPAKGMEPASIEAVDPYARTEPPVIKPVDMQRTQIQELGKTTQQADGTGDAHSGTTNSLFDRGGKKMPLTDGLAGGSESNDATSRNAAPATVVNAVDGFDYGVLDGRIRIGVFGKGKISDYRVSVTTGRYVIEMPGEYRYVEEFSRRLTIDQLGISAAQLKRDARGMRMIIEVTPALQHEPFLLEDRHGLIVAFEPRLN
jgi:hypothetical protein